MSNRLSLVSKQVANLIEPILEEMRFEVVDVEYLTQLGRWVLRVYIDKEGGVTINDCARVSGEIGDLKKGDIVKAKQKIHSAIKNEEQVEATIDKSIGELKDASEALDIELYDDD